MIWNQIRSKNVMRVYCTLIPLYLTFLHWWFITCLMSVNDFLTRYIDTVDLPQGFSLLDNSCNRIRWGNANYKIFSNLSKDAWSVSTVLYGFTKSIYFVHYKTQYFQSSIVMYDCFLCYKHLKLMSFWELDCGKREMILHLSD